MKSSDEIKKAMLHCSPVSCRSDGCPYKDDTPKYEGDMPVCRMKLWHDMGCLIQQKEQENAEQAERIRQLETALEDMTARYKIADDCAKKKGEMNEKLYAELTAVKAERDAAVAGLKSNCVCPECKYFSDDIQEPCRGCKPNDSKFEWRGVQKEE